MLRNLQYGVTWLSAGKRQSGASRVDQEQFAATFNQSKVRMAENRDAGPVAAGLGCKFFKPSLDMALMAV